jgi:hypothetical protein
MNRDEILNMPAGREMDALVAEKVMGLNVSWWSIHHVSDYEGDGPFRSLHSADEIMLPDQDGDMPVLQTFTRGDNYVMWNVTPFYSTDIAAALQVVEKLTENFYIDIGIDSSGTQVQLDRFNGEDWTFGESIEAPTAPLAICRAALLTTLEGDR